MTIKTETVRHGASLKTATVTLSKDGEIFKVLSTVRKGSTGFTTSDLTAAEEVFKGAVIDARSGCR